MPVDQVAIVPGAQAGLFTALMLLLGMEDGSEVLVGTPCYSTYEPTIQLAGGKLVSVPLSPDDRFTLRPQVLPGAGWRANHTLLGCRVGKNRD